VGVSLLDGWLPWTLLVLGIAGGVFLLARRERWWWLYVVPATVVVSGISAWIIGNTVAKSVIGQDLSFSDQIWIADWNGKATQTRAYRSDAAGRPEMRQGDRVSVPAGLFH